MVDKDEGTRSGTKKAVFLDRDGVINRRKRTLVKSWSEFKFIPGVKEAVKDFVEHGYLVIVITNQDVVGWGFISDAALEDIHNKMRSELSAAGGKITDIFYCPHNPVRKCKCRKPSPEMLIQAAEKYGISPELSWMVGDKVTDVQAGNAFGCRTVLINPRNKSIKKVDTKESKNDPDFKVKNLKEASGIILNES